ncbi:MAG TPA: hypothetical protein VMS60_07935 [Solirubrobacterales bacterium]|nr:hypothetical protein [Solirubrobacterales bacterium]
MLFVGRNGTRFELTVAGYQFPDLPDEGLDSNWLEINTDVVSPQGSWTCTDPTLLTDELESLASWLESIAAAQPHEPEISFLEPNLCFELRDETGDSMTLRIWFELESRPIWSPAKAADARDLWIDLEVPRRSARRSASELRHHLQEFPSRAAVRTD